MVDYFNPSNKSYPLLQNLCCNLNLVPEYQSKYLLTGAHQNAILIRFVKFESTSKHTSSNKKKHYTEKLLCENRNVFSIIKRNQLLIDCSSWAIIL